MQWLLLVFLVCDITHFALLSSQKTTCTPLPLELQCRQSKILPAWYRKCSLKGATGTDKERMAELEKIEAHGAENGWVAPMTAEDREFFAYFRSVFKRYNISPSKATRLEYDFVTRVAESEFYLQKVNA